jgi:hypothetical protein
VLRQAIWRIKQLEVTLGLITFDNEFVIYGINQFNNLGAPIGGHYLIVLNKPRPMKQSLSINWRITNNSEYRLSQYNYPGFDNYSQSADANTAALDFSIGMVFSDG